MQNTIFPFNNTYIKLPKKFYSEASPTKVPNPELILWNESLAKDLRLSLDSSTESNLCDIFSGNQVPAGAQPIALAYAGHQFGHFVPQLGDGRALLLGEVIDINGTRYDIQLKGSGVTPFSRQGDGKSPLGPVIREYIVSEAMFHLGVPTTRALAATTTGETVYREEALPGGVFTRVASSHIRVGSFAYFAAQGDTENLQLLLDYSVNRHYPQIKGEPNVPLAFLKAVVDAQASLVAHWMDIGFIHGVMNTDNTSISGITIDYGPCAFMDHFNPQQVYSYIDQQGRYAYCNQLPIVQWNLSRLAETMIPLMGKDQKESIQLLEKELDHLKDQFDSYWLKRMTRKIGLFDVDSQDFDLISTWLNYLEEKQLDYTLSFRKLSGLLDEQNKDSFFNKTESFHHFINLWNNRLDQQGINKQDVKKLMDENNPLYIPRNHQVERAIQDAYKGDYSTFKEMVQVLKSPFTEQPGFERYTEPPLSHEMIQNTFCGT